MTFSITTANPECVMDHSFAPNRTQKAMSVLLRLMDVAEDVEDLNGFGDLANDLRTSHDTILLRLLEE